MYQTISLGEFDFSKIGAPYPDNVPVTAMRAVPAFAGSLLAPTVYQILCQLGASSWAGGLAGLLLILDTALLAQSRFILLDSIMILFALWALLSVLKLRQYHSKPFSSGWWFWLTSASFNMGLAFCVKYMAIYSCWLCCYVLLRDFWRRLADRGLTNIQLALEFVCGVAVTCTIPLAIYIGSFYVHLSILTKAGVHDSLMTSAFQASLEGGLSSIVMGQPRQIVHGSQITLRHTHGRPCWLHSHEAVYPAKYTHADRGSSYQQQVTCYGHKDVNNWWLVKRPDREDLAVHEPLDVIRHGEVIQLVHGMTHRALNSHDVAAPMSPTHQEISCYIDYNVSMPAQNLWRVEIVNEVKPEADPENGKEKASPWNIIESQVRLVHVDTNHAMRFSSKLLPEWGFHQNEVVGDRNHDNLDAAWNVEEHRYTKNDEDKRSLEVELFRNELIPQTPTYLSFWEKFVELQLKMLISNHDNVKNHNYASDPFDWPFLTRGIAYYVAKNSNAQVHLIGNFAIWVSSTLGLVAYSGLLVGYLLRRQRLCFDIPEGESEGFHYHEPSVI